MEIASRRSCCGCVIRKLHHPLDLQVEMPHFGFERDDQLVVAMIAPDEFLQMLRKPRIEAHEVAPLASRIAAELGQHLSNVLDGNRARHHPVKMRFRHRAFDLQQPNITDPAIGRGSEPRLGRMDHITATGDGFAGVALVSGGGGVFVIEPPLHLSRDEMLIRDASESLADQLGAVGFALGFFLAFVFALLDYGDDVGRARRGDIAAAEFRPEITALNAVEIVVGCAHR
jgi:hypothetical protein